MYFNLMSSQIIIEFLLIHNQFYEYKKCFNLYFINITALKSIYFKHYKGMVKLFNLSLIICIKLNMILNF